MDLLLVHLYEVFFIAFIVFLVFAVVKMMKRNNTVYQKYDQSLEMSKTIMERQSQALKLMEETNSLLTQILAALKKK